MLLGKMPYAEGLEYQPDVSKVLNSKKVSDHHAIIPTIGENYDTYPVKFEQMSLRIEKTSEIQLFIFNIGKIFNSKTDTQFNFHKFKETLGASFADVLAQFDDLVICMDEAHRYYACLLYTSKF